MKEESKEISAYAFNLGIKFGEDVEKEINERTNNLVDRNKKLEAKILGYSLKLRDEVRQEYIEYFKIKITK